WAISPSVQGQELVTTCRDRTVPAASLPISSTRGLLRCLTSRRTWHGWRRALGTILYCRSLIWARRAGKSLISKMRTCLHTAWAAIPTQLSRTPRGLTPASDLLTFGCFVTAEPVL